MSQQEISGNDTLARLAAVIDSRRGGDPDKSYVARLFSKGTDAILKKIGEEATETVMAAKDGDRKKLVGEVADLWFHTLVALSAFDLKPADVLAELERREGLSGLDEFALRKMHERERLQADDKRRSPPEGDEQSGKATFSREIKEP
jgi:phosphoribosyl-ATP pyrophosphohydrolase